MIKRIYYKISLLTGIIFLFTFCNYKAQIESQSLDNSEKQEIVDKISSLLSENYVFPDIADKCGLHIQSQLNSGEFDHLEDPEEFARKLTEELQSVSKDKHMRVRIRQPQSVQMENEDPNRALYRQLNRLRESNFGFKKIEVLDGNVGYIDMRYFAEVSAGEKTAVSAMKFLSNTDAIIFDMRKNGGGNPAMIQLVCSYFFSEPTHLNSLYWRRGDRTDEFWTLEEIDGKRLPDIPLFVLTSNYTFSGAEEFSYNMQTRKRATLIGEITGGGANPGGTFPIVNSFSIFIPTGRAINPVTGTNWEGVGVKPEIEVSAEEAYDLALEKALIAAEEYRVQKENNAVSILNESESSLKKANELFADNKVEEAEKLVFTGLDLAINSEIGNEAYINMLGYRYLGEKKNKMAIAVFKYNVNKFPQSSNVYDSLGEAYMEDGQFDLAIKYYNKSIELDPDNENAKSNIEKMKEK